MHETNSYLAVEILIHSLLLIVILLSVIAILNLDKPVFNPAPEHNTRASSLIRSIPEIIHSVLPSTLSSRIIQNIHPVISNPARSIQALLNNSSQSRSTGTFNRRVSYHAPSEIDKEELYCLALNNYFEARGESRLGQYAVASVVLNRVKNPRFPDSICGVVKQGGFTKKYQCQFSWWCDGMSDKPMNKKAWKQSIELARSVLKKHHNDITAGALWYHADYVRPYWRTSMKRGPKIGRHIFYSAKRNHQRRLG
ncbi:MAG: cell wall hydrolase [Gammaproteobacteria bacterium]|nr:cell wall hydrolase [Gammaproteobacteria bacterium]